MSKTIQSDKVLRDKAFDIASNPKYDGHQRGLASMVGKFFDKKSRGSGVNFMRNQSSTWKKLNKSIIRKLKKEKFIL